MTIMPLTLLITANEDLARLLAQAIPEIAWRRISRADEFLSAGDQERPRLVIWDATREARPGDALRALSRHPFLAGLPLLAILDRPEGRQSVLAAGARDYLLLPLLPEEVTERVGRCLGENGRLAPPKDPADPSSLRLIRLAAIGRLTASLVHEINNPMQTIQGALTLALEDPQDAAEVDSYLRVSLQESERVVRIVDRIRAIYNPSPQSPQVADVNRAAEEAAATALKELLRQKVRLTRSLAEDLPPAAVMEDLVYLVVLSLILDFSALIGESGGGELHLRTIRAPQFARIEVETRQPSNPAPIGESDLQLSLLRESLAPYSASIQVQTSSQRCVAAIILPIAQ